MKKILVFLFLFSTALTSKTKGQENQDYFSSLNSFKNAVAYDLIFSHGIDEQVLIMLYKNYNFLNRFKDASFTISKYFIVKDSLESVNSNAELIKLKSEQIDHVCIMGIRIT